MPAMAVMQEWVDVGCTCSSSLTAHTFNILPTEDTFGPTQPLSAAFHPKYQSSK